MLESPRSRQNIIISKIIITVLVLSIVATTSLLVYELLHNHNQSGKSIFQNSKTADKLSARDLVSAIKTIADFNVSEEDLPDKLNILVVGIPGSGYPGSKLTDSIVIVHLEPKLNKLLAVSLPRDLLVQLPNKGSSVKINSLYYLSGISGLQKKVGEITGINCDYYVIVDLQTVEEIIDLIDGVNIYVPQDIYDPYFPGPNSSYTTFTIKSGWRYLDGKNALRYMRTRYTSPHGDFDRIVRQQQVLRAVKQKVFALNPLWDFNKYLKIYESLHNRITTNLTLTDIKNLFYIAQNLDLDKIRTTTIDRENTNLVIGSIVTLGETPASVVLPQAGYENYAAIRSYINDLANR